MHEQQLFPRTVVGANIAIHLVGAEGWHVQIAERFDGGSRDGVTWTHYDRLSLSEALAVIEEHLLKTA